jgi:hypothetical protein
MVLISVIIVKLKTKTNDTSIFIKKILSKKRTFFLKYTDIMF